MKGAGTASGEGTWGSAINAGGAIAGYDLDSSFVYHGFVRGKVFDAPGAGKGGAQGTLAYAINSTRAAAGYFIDSSNAVHGFARSADGTVTPFDVGKAVGTSAYGINDTGSITGSWFDSGQVEHGFLRAPDGTISKFDARGAGTGSYQGTFAVSINTGGDIVGQSIDDNNVFHGFLRSSGGKLKVLDAPGAGTGEFQGTYATAINDKEVIAGSYYDSSGIARFPAHAVANLTWHGVAEISSVKRDNVGRERVLLRNLYGTTYDSGANGNGTVYRLARKSGAWSEKLLYSFKGAATGQARSAISFSIPQVAAGGTARRFGLTAEPRSRHGSYCVGSFVDGRMSAFALYVIGFIALLGGLIYGAYLVHIPHTWIIVGALVLIGIGIMSAVSHTKRRDPPAEPPRAPNT